MINYRSPDGVVVKDIAIGAGGQGFDSPGRSNQYSVVNGSSSLRCLFRAVLPRAVLPRRSVAGWRSG